MGFFLKIFGVVVLFAFAFLILFSLIGVAWAAWGGFATLLVIAAILLGFGWWYDHRPAPELEE
jgi:hypothetical protein